MEYKICFTYFATIFVVSIYNLEAFEIRNCGSYFRFMNITLDGCNEHDLRCPLVIGKTTNISFVVKTESFNTDANLMNDVAFYVRGIKFSLSATPLNPCEVLKCPLDVNYIATFSAGIYIDTKYVPLRGDLRWVIATADGNEQVMCFQIPVYMY